MFQCAVFGSRSTKHRLAGSVLTDRPTLRLLKKSPLGFWQFAQLANIVAGEEQPGRQVTCTILAAQFLDLGAANARGFLHHDPAGPREEYSWDVHGNHDLLLIRGLDVEIKAAATVIYGLKPDIPNVSFAI